MIEVINWVIFTIFVLAVFGVFEIRYVRLKIKLLKEVEKEIKKLTNARENFSRFMDSIQNMDRDKMDR
jgi:hypothetical protein